jgi:protein-S-isoprenylcysteine O-methyltransferase Ste14
MTMTEDQSFQAIKKGAYLRVGLALPILALVILLPAGKWDYWQGWLYLLILYIPMFFVLYYLLKNDPALLQRRMRMREKESVQRRIIVLSLVYFLVAFTLPGFDVRFGWSNMPAWVSLVADVLVFTGYMTFVWVLTINSYLSRVVEVEAGQKVITTGPYAIVRHPMYAGIILMYTASPVALGSWWALIPALFIIPLLVARIRNEEQVLLRDLPGYAEYVQKVKYRLLPGVW